MKKIVRIGTIKERNRWASIYCKIEYNDNKLSISGVIGPLPSGNALGGCGQIDMEFKHRYDHDNDQRYDKNNLIKPSDINWAKGWNARLLYTFLDIWKNWHLNDMKAGCEHQDLLNITKTSEECPVCQYKHGHAWTKRKIPQAVIDILEYLPETDKTPAWV